MEHNENHKQSGRSLNVDMRGVVGVGMVASALILLLLLMSLVTSYTNNKQQLAQQLTVISVASDVNLEVTYPQQLQLNAKPGKVVVRLRVGETAVFTPPLTITLNTPPSIAISGTVQGRHTFTEGNGAPATFLLVNTAVLPLRQQQTITLTHSLTDAPTLLTIDVEAPGTAAWREFILDTISDKSPLLLTLAALLPIVTLVLQYAQKQEERETVRQEQQLAKDKLLLSEQVEQLRRYLTETNRAGIQRIWMQINQSRSIKFLPPQEYNWLEWLVALSLEGTLAPHNAPENWIKEIQDEWTSELVGALICAKEFIQPNPTPYKSVFQDMPLEKVADLSLRNQFIRLWRKVEPIDLQANTQEVIPQRDAPRESPLIQSELRHMLPQDPFLHLAAEDEETSLLGQDGFWFWHPVYSALVNAPRLQMVYGPVGCGRTALAKSLCYHGSRATSFFWHYQAVHEGFQDSVGLRHELAQQLLRYITAKPTLLLSVQESQRQLIADVLVDALTKQPVLAQLEEALDSETWLKSATEAQEPVWRKVGETQLALLTRTVETAVSTIRLTDNQWMNGLTKSFTFFGFDGVRLLLDCAPETVGTMLFRLPALQEWPRFGLIATLFVPGNQGNTLGAPTLHLDWSQAQLTELFAHRLFRLADFRNPRELFQDESVYNSFMELVVSDTITLPATPRKLAQLWQAGLKSIGDQEAIKQDTLEKAKALVLRQIAEGRRATSEQPIDRVQLAQLLDDTFDTNELRSLCFALGVDYGNIPGDTKRNKIEELIQLLGRTGRMAELWEQYRQRRPRHPQ